MTNKKYKFTDYTFTLEDRILLDAFNLNISCPCYMKIKRYKYYNPDDKNPKFYLLYEDVIIKISADDRYYVICKIKNYYNNIMYYQYKEIYNSKETLIDSWHSLANVLEQTKQKIEELK